MDDTDKIFREYKAELSRGMDSIDIDCLKKAIGFIWKAYREDRQIFICGNGGSAATSSHLCCDLGKGTLTEGKRRLRIISLADNIALISAWSNDSDYSKCFKEQLVNLLKDGDVLIGISASGNSENVIKAVEYAKSRGAATIGFLGFEGGKLLGMVDAAVLVRSNEYEVPEDIHLCLGHILKKALRQLIVKEDI